MVKVQNLRLDLPFGEVKVGDKRLPVILTKSAWAHLNANWKRGGGYEDFVEIGAVLQLLGDATLAELAADITAAKAEAAQLRAQIEASRNSDIEDQLARLRGELAILQGMMGVTSGSIPTMDEIEIGADQVSFDPAGGIAAEDVQAAIEELDTEKAPKADPQFTGLTKFGDADYYAALDTGNPVLSFSTNDYVAYDRTNEVFAVYIGGVAKFSVDTTGITIGLDADLTTIAGLSPSNDDLLQRKAGAWTNRTPAQFKTDLALIKGDVGLGNVDNTSDANKPVSTAQQTALDLKANLASPLLTGTVQLGGSNFNALLSGSNPNIAVDTNDYIAYDRTSNAYGFYIGSTLECQITATGVTADGFFVDANCSLAFVSSNPTLAFDTNDYLVYDRTGNTASLYINSVLCAKFTESSLTAGPELFGRVQFGDNQFYARLNTNPFLTFDSSDYISYDRTSNIMGFYIGGTAELLIDANGLTVNSATMIKTTTAFTNGAGAGAGTLTNAPAAGDPTKWIPVDDNGTTRYIPAW